MFRELEKIGLKTIAICGGSPYDSAQVTRTIWAKHTMSMFKIWTAAFVTVHFEYPDISQCKESLYDTLFSLATLKPTLVIPAIHQVTLD